MTQTSEIAWHFSPHLAEAALDKVLCAPPTGESNSSEGELARLRCAMRSAVFGGGKRLRSQLVLEAAHVAAAANRRELHLEEVLPVACALELIHAYSLVHDDLPAMDDAETRRGRPSCHHEYGEATAILVGDALLTLAFEVMACGIPVAPAQSTLCRENVSGNGAAPAQNGHPTLSCIALVARAAGEAGMAGGQMIDIAWSNGHTTDISGDELSQMHALKTGALIRCASESGALLGGGTREQITALRDYGAHVGRAFQIHDDVLDVEGDPKMTGKAATDQANDKTTAPAVWGLEHAKELANQASQSACDALHIFGDEADTLRALARFVAQREK